MATLSPIQYCHLSEEVSTKAFLQLIMKPIELIFGLLLAIYFVPPSRCQPGDCLALEEAADSHESILGQLVTNKFYQLTLSHPEYGRGYFTWASRTDSTGAKLTFVDYNKSNFNYKIGRRWYNDTLWAFKKSEKDNFYYMYNCRYPDKYLTSSLDAADKDKEKQLVLDDLNKRPAEAYIWMLGGSVIQGVCQGYGPCAFIGQSYGVYHPKSYFMSAIDAGNFGRGQQYRFNIEMWDT